MLKSRVKKSSCCLLSAIQVTNLPNYKLRDQLIFDVGEGKAYKAYEVLKDCSQPQNRYKLALTCMKLNKMQEAERVLLNKKNFKQQQQFDINTVLNQVPNGAAGIYLLGQICEKQAKKKDAKDHYNRALQMDPTLWSAFERLCKLQTNIDPSKYFPDNHAAILKLTEYIRTYQIP